MTETAAIPADTGITDPTGDPPRDELEPASDRPAVEDASRPVDVPDGEGAPVEEAFERAYETDPRNDIYKRAVNREAADAAESAVLFGKAGGDDVQDESDAARATRLANEGGKVKIRVYGQDREVPVEEAIQAGIATLQKDAAADQRLAGAAEKERQLEARARELQGIEENLRRGLDSQGQPIVPQPPTQGASRNREEQMKAVTDAAAAVRTAVFEGDQDATQAALLKFHEASAAASGSGNTDLPAIIKSVTTAVRADLARDQRDAEARASVDAAERDRQEANRVFKVEFPDLLADKDSMAMAKGLATRLAADPEWAPKGHAAIAREVGRRLKAKIAPSGLERTLADRRGAKRDVPTSTAAGRQPPAPEQTQPSNRDYVRQLQVNSGSNAVPRR